MNTSLKAHMKTLNAALATLLFACAAGPSFAAEVDATNTVAKPAEPVAGSNPIFRNTFTADPSTLVVGDTLYCYTGHDKAVGGQFFTMPDWLCYSTKDMTNWTAHGSILKATDFKYGSRNSAWAAQAIEKGGKYFFYVTLTITNSPAHCIAVAVGDSPVGPFKDARGTPLITDDMTKDSRRPNADIDPTVFIDDDGTPWLAWGNGDCYLV
jgi:beta-xylosidase